MTALTHRRSHRRRRCISRRVPQRHGARRRRRGLGAAGRVAAAYALEHLGGQSHAYTLTRVPRTLQRKLWSPGGAGVGKIVASCTLATGPSGGFRRRHAGTPLAARATQGGGRETRRSSSSPGGFTALGGVGAAASLSRCGAAADSERSGAAAAGLQRRGHPGAGLPQRRQPRAAERHGHRLDQTVRERTYGLRLLGLRGRRAAGREVLRGHRDADRSHRPHRHQFEHVGQDGRRARGGGRVPEDHEAGRPRRGRRVRRRRRYRPVAHRGPRRCSSRASGGPWPAGRPRSTTPSTSR